MKYTIAFALLFVLGINTLNAQITEGVINYEITIDSEVPAMAEMFQNSNMKVFFHGDLTRTEFNMGTFISTSTISNSENNNSLILMDSMMGKFAIETTGEETEKLKAQNETNNQVELVNETKDILGFECKKAIVSNVDLEDQVIIWYAPNIQFDQSMNQQMSFEVPGTALEFETQAEGMTMNFKATSFNKELINSNELFNFEIPEGYTKQSLEELMQLSGQ